MNDSEKAFCEDDLRKTQILIVDDSKLMQTMIIAAINVDSCEVRTADDGDKALAMIEECKPDVVLLDQTMPGLSGNEVLKILKSDEKTQDIMVVMVTSSSETFMVEESLSLGAIDFVPKPFTEGVLKARIKNVVRTNLLLREQKLLISKADAANKSKSEFLANMSHEIRTPMTAILGFAEILLNEDGLEHAPKHRLEAFSTIQRNGQFLLEIINDILDLSKIESDKLIVEHIACSPREIVADVAKLMQVRASPKGCPCGLSTQDQYPRAFSPIRLDYDRY